MNNRESAFFAVTPRNVIGLSVLFLVLASILGLLNSQKMKTLHADVTNARAARDAGEHRRVTQEQKIENGAITITGGEDNLAEAKHKAAKAEADLAQLQKEKADLQSKLDANQNEITSLQKRVAEAEKPANPAGNPAGPTPTGALQAQLDDVRHQLDSAEKEKAFCRKNSRALRSARLRSRTRKDGGKLASAEQVCAVPSLRSIRRTILWCSIWGLARVLSRTRNCLFCAKAR